MSAVDAVNVIGATSNSFAQIGHGGAQTDAKNLSGSITVLAASDLDLVSGQEQHNYAQIGHGDLSLNDHIVSITGDIEIGVAGTVSETETLPSGKVLIGHASNTSTISGGPSSINYYDPSTGSGFVTIPQNTTNPETRLSLLEEAGSCSFEDAMCLDPAGIIENTESGSGNVLVSAVKLNSSQRTDDPNTQSVEDGKIEFNHNGQVLELIAYKSVVSQNRSTGQLQCTELIKRYAVLLGYKETPNYTGGDGKDAARNFSDNVSKGGFEFIDQSSGPVSLEDLPREGAVLSIDGWEGLSAGHVGIVVNIKRENKNGVLIRYTISLFDQNMPINGWKEVEFNLTDSGSWKGVMINNGIKRPVAGWANPT